MKELIKVPIPNSLGSESISQLYMRRSRGKTFFYWLFAVCSLGMAPLFISWTQRAKFFATFSQCREQHASHLLVTAEDGGIDFIPIEIIKVDGINRKMVVFRFIRFMYDEQRKVFIKGNIISEISQSTIKEALPLYSSSVIERRKIVGMNSLKTPITPMLTVLFGEILNVYNIYQVFACIIWAYRDYSDYSALIVVTMGLTIIIDLYDNRKAQRRLREMSEVKGQSKVIRDEGITLVEPSTNIVPGDRILIERGIIAPCDIIVVDGECLVNEAVLTGESVPVFKIEISLSENKFDFEKGQKHIIYCGSRILKSQSKLNNTEAIGYVAKIGFDTLKGQITRGIMYPKLMKFKHEKEMDKFLISLISLSIFLVSTFYIYSFIIIESPFSTWVVLIFGFDIFLTSLPPGLPLCLLIGISFAVKKLKKSNIICLRPFLINAAGRVKTLCFDKTGTLTGSSMDFTGVSVIDHKGSETSNH